MNYEKSALRFSSYAAVANVLCRHRLWFAASRKSKKDPVFYVKWNTGSFLVTGSSLILIFYFKIFRKIQVMIPTTQNGKYVG